MMLSKKILIVGSGPVGLTLAIQLLKHEIDVEIIEKRNGPTKISRAIGISPLTLRIFDRLDVLETILQKGKKVKKIILLWEKNKISHIKSNYFYCDYDYFFHTTQPVVEKGLLERFHNLGGRVRYESELINFKNFNEKIIVDIKSKSNKTQEEFDYVIGCDGGKSIVRSLSNIACHYLDYGHSFILADVNFDKKFISDETYYFAGKEGYLMVIPLPNEQYRVIASIKGDYVSDNKKIENDLNFYINKRTNLNIKIKEVFWSTSAKFRQMITDKCRNNNVYIAGDAFHLFSPIGGTNMNFGINDAYTLAWRLAHTIKYGLNNELLDSYEPERMQAVKNNEDLTKKLTNMLLNNESYPYFEDKLLPLMKNRKAIREKLPGIFSGFESTIMPEQKNGYKEYYYPKKLKAILNEYELKTDRKIENNLLVIFGDCSSFIETTLNHIKNKFGKYLEIKRLTSEFKLNNKIDLGNCFIRPDGIIQLRQMNEDLTEFIVRVENYIIKNYSGISMYKVDHKVAFFDVDETLLKLKTMKSFIKFYSCQDSITPIRSKFTYYSLMTKIKFFEIFKLKREYLNRIFYKVFKNRSVSVIEAVCEKWFYHLLEKKESFFNENVIKRLNNHLKNDDVVVLVSGSFKECLMPLARYLNIKNILCIELETMNGRYTGAIRSIQTIGKGKADAIKKFMKANGYSYASSYAYGDHISDIPMLELAENKVVVPGDRKIIKYAKLKGWEILGMKNEI